LELHDCQSLIKRRLRFGAAFSDNTFQKTHVLGSKKPHVLGQKQGFPNFLIITKK